MHFLGGLMFQFISALGAPSELSSFFFDLAISGKVLSFSLIICSAIRTKVHFNQSDDCFVTKIAFHENELILKSGK